MNDKLLLSNYLLLLKSTIEVYVHGTIESSNEEARNVLKNGLIETLNHQSKVYEQMVCYDFYIVDNIDPEIIQNSYKCLCKEN